MDLDIRESDPELTFTQYPDHQSLLLSPLMSQQDLLGDHGSVSNPSEQPNLNKAYNTSGTPQREAF